MHTSSNMSFRNLLELSKKFKERKMKMNSKENPPANKEKSATPPAEASKAAAAEEPQEHSGKHPTNHEQAHKGQSIEELERLSNLGKPKEQAIPKSCSFNGVAQFLVVKSSDQASEFWKNNHSENTMCKTCFKIATCGDDSVKVLQEDSEAVFELSIANLMPVTNKCTDDKCPVKLNHFQNEGACVSAVFRQPENSPKRTCYFCFKDKQNGYNFKTNLISKKLANQERRGLQSKKPSPTKPGEPLNLNDFKGRENLLPPPQPALQPPEYKEAPISPRSLKREKCRLYEFDGEISFNSDDKTFKKETKMTVMRVNLDTICVLSPESLIQTDKSDSKEDKQMVPNTNLFCLPIKHAVYKSIPGPQKCGKLTSGSRYINYCPIAGDKSQIHLLEKTINDFKGSACQSTREKYSENSRDEKKLGDELRNVLAEAKNEFLATKRRERKEQFEMQKAGDMDDLEKSTNNRFLMKLMAEIKRSKEVAKEIEAKEHEEMKDLQDQMKREDEKRKKIEEAVKQKEMENQMKVREEEKKKELQDRERAEELALRSLQKADSDLLKRKNMFFDAARKTALSKINKKRGLVWSKSAELMNYAKNDIKRCAARTIPEKTEFCSGFPSQETECLDEKRFCSFCCSTQCNGDERTRMACMNSYCEQEKLDPVTGSFLWHKD